jgi:hypothetical protein
VCCRGCRGKKVEEWLVFILLEEFIFHDY